MKIVFNIKNLKVFVAALFLVCGSLSNARAQTNTVSVPAIAPAPAASAVVIPPPPSPPLQHVDAANGPMKTNPTGLTAAENKIPDSVKDVLKRLDRPTEEVTLDDLNSARQAVAKIDILIDIEKHLAELDKIRHEREKDNGFSAMIPASALQPPMYAAQSASVVQAQVPSALAPPAAMPAMMPKEAAELMRISGDNGHYAAIVKMAGEENKTVHVGDKLPDGSSITAISPMEVVLDHNGTKRTLHVKNVDTVFGNSF